MARVVLRDADAMSVSNRLQPPARLRVVVAEDDYELRRLITSVLVEDGYEVVDLVDGRELILHLVAAAARPHRFPKPDLVISDVRMPHFTGLDVLERSRRAWSGIPVVLITAFPDTSTLDEAARLGAVTVVAKPFDLDDLRMIVLNLIGGARRRSVARSA